jgi:hypothetical protein
VRHDVETLVNSVKSVLLLIIAQDELLLLAI